MIKSLLNLLIVDDNEVNLMFLEAILGKLQLNLIKAESGFEALDKSKGKVFANAILDIQMPVMNCYVATRQIRQFNAKVLIVALTAFALTGDRKKAIEAGCNDFIAKPVKKDELTGLIQKYFGY
jgi:CheY-like chemotaxis protein